MFGKSEYDKNNLNTNESILESGSTSPKIDGVFGKRIHINQKISYFKSPKNYVK